MPPTKSEFYYWDSCVFLSYITNSPERINVLDALWEKIAKHPQQKIITSSISILEVAYASGDGRPKRMPRETEEAIDQLWSDPSIEVVEVFPHLLYRARDLMRNALSENWSLKPNDAVHLVTAQWVAENIGKVHELHTYDQRIRKFSAMIGNIPIREPYILQPGLLENNIDDSSS